MQITLVFNRSMKIRPRDTRDNGFLHKNKNSRDKNYLFSLIKKILILYYQLSEFGQEINNNKSNNMDGMT